MSVFFVPTFPGCGHGVEAVLDIVVAVDLFVRRVRVAVHRAHLREKYADHELLLVMRSAGLLRRIVAEMHPHLPLQADLRVINPHPSFIPRHQVVHFHRASLAIDAEEFYAKFDTRFYLIDGECVRDPTTLMHPVAKPFRHDCSGCSHRTVAQLC